MNAWWKSSLWDEPENRRKADPAYDIYIHFDPARSSDGRSWEKRHTTPCAKQARQHAEELHRMDFYPRVEIRKKYFDFRSARTVDCKIKVYEKKRFLRHANFRVFVWACLCALMICFALVLT